MAASMQEFDDDTEFELPGAPVALSPPGGGQTEQMNMLEEMMAQMGGGRAPPFDAAAAKHVAVDGAEDGPHKHWTCVYPIYLDAKRRYRKGARRVAYDKAVLFPNSQYIANAAKMLRFEYMHEDWENPGRVKIKLHADDGMPVRSELSTKHQLLEALATAMQPHIGGKPPALAPSGKGTGPTSLRARARRIARVQFAEKLPPHSPALPAGMLNMDLGSIAGAGDALKSMGPLGNMISSMGLGADDEEDEADQEPAPKTAPALGRRQRNYNCGEQGHVSSACSKESVPKSCFRCGESGHVSRECPQVPVGESAPGGGECYRCGQEGHIARMCPKTMGGVPPRAAAAPGGRGCFNCGGLGHISRECSSAPGAVAASGGIGPKCYNCGQMGHISRECAQPPQRSCYTCGSADHLAAGCPQVV
ncbi:signal recognition particle subunit [Malassezia sp. CBS 17886]|nr:signal recognition particle subunit [Malassezia sp. CBS 17886]